MSIKMSVGCILFSMSCVFVSGCWDSQFDNPFNCLQVGIEKALEPDKTHDKIFRNGTGKTEYWDKANEDWERRKEAMKIKYPKFKGKFPKTSIIADWPEEYQSFAYLYAYRMTITGADTVSFPLTSSQEKMAQKIIANGDAERISTGIAIGHYYTLFQSGRWMYFYEGGKTYKQGKAPRNWIKK